MQASYARDWTANKVRMEPSAIEVVDTEWRDVGEDSGSEFEENMEDDYFGLVSLTMVKFQPGLTETIIGQGAKRNIRNTLHGSPNPHSSW